MFWHVNDVLRFNIHTYIHTYIYIYIYVIIYVFVNCLMNVYCEEFTVFIIKLMELSLKIEMSHFIVSDIVATRRVVTSPVSSSDLCYELRILALY